MLSLLIVVGGIILRLAPHIPNFTPISATALFGGATLNKKLAVLTPLIAVAVSDYLLLYINPFRYPILDFSYIYPISAMFHSTTLYVWGSFIISGLIGIWLKNHKSFINIIFACLVVSIQFYLITNFGVWAGGMYSRGLNGLLESYIMGLPFFKWTLLGDFFYTGVFLGSYELALKINEKSKTLISLVP